MRVASEQPSGMFCDPRTPPEHSLGKTRDFSDLVDLVWLRPELMLHLTLSHSDGQIQEYGCSRGAVIPGCHVDLFIPCLDTGKNYPSL